MSDQTYVPVPPVAASMASKVRLTSVTARRAVVNGSVPVIPTCSRTTIPSALVSERESPFILASTVKSN